MIRIIRCVFLGVCLLMPAGCAGMFDPGPPMTNVILPSEMPAFSEAGRLPVHLRVGRPAADSSTDTDRIMALMNGYEVRALDSAKWVSPVPVMLQRQIVDALEASRRFAAVGGDGGGTADKFRLASDIRRFFLRYDDSRQFPVVDLAIVFSLTKTETGSIIARRFVRIEEPCTGNSLDAFVAAFSRAMTQTLAITAKWTAEQLEAQLAAPPKKQSRK